MEISGSIAAEVVRLMQDWENVQVMDDLQKVPRVVIARKR